MPTNLNLPPNVRDGIADGTIIVPNYMKSPISGNLMLDPIFIKQHSGNLNAGQTVDSSEIPSLNYVPFSHRNVKLRSFIQDWIAHVNGNNVINDDDTLTLFRLGSSTLPPSQNIAADYADVFELLETFENIFEKEISIPEYLKCPISFDVMKKPVLVKETGISYEEEHIRTSMRNRPICPSSSIRLFNFDRLDLANNYVNDQNTARILTTWLNNTRKSAHKIMGLARGRRDRLAFRNMLPAAAIQQPAAAAIQQPVQAAAVMQQPVQEAAVMQQPAAAIQQPVQAAVMQQPAAAIQQPAAILTGRQKYAASLRRRKR